MRMFLRFFEKVPNTYLDIFFYRIKISIILIFYAIVSLFYAIFQTFKIPKKFTTKYLYICLRLIQIKSEKGETTNGTEFKHVGLKATSKVVDELNSVRKKRKKG